MSNVSPKAFRDDMLGAFTGFWTPLHPAVLIAYPNLPFDPEDIGEAPDAAWVRVFIQGAQDLGQIRYSNSLSTNFWQRNGQITFEIYVREQASTDVAYDLASDVALWLENPGSAFAWMSNISAPVEIGPDGSWFQISVSADWSYLTDRAA